MRIRSCFAVAVLYCLVFAGSSFGQVVLSHPVISETPKTKTIPVLGTDKKPKKDSDDNLIADTVQLRWEIETFRFGATGGLETKGDADVPSDPSAGLIFEYNPFWNPRGGKMGVRRITGYFAVNTSAGRDTLTFDKSSVQALVLPGAANTIAAIGFEIAWRIDKNFDDDDLNDFAGFLEFNQSKYTVKDSFSTSPEVHDFSSRSAELGIRWDGTAKVGKSYGVFSLGAFLRGFWIDQSGKAGFVRLNETLNISGAPTSFGGHGFLAKARFNQFGVEFRWVDLSVRGKGKDFDQQIPGITGGIFSLRTTFTGDIFGG